MKILIISSRVPFPLDKGDKLRTFNFIKELSKYNEIILVAVNDDAYSKLPYNELKKYCQDVHFYGITKGKIFLNLFLNLFTSKPFQVAYFMHRSVDKKIKNIIDTQKPDLVFYQMLRTAEYAKNVDILKVIDYMDTLSVGLERRIEKENLFKKIFFKNEFNRVANYENAIFNRFQKQLIITEQDKKLIPHPNNIKIDIVTNGVDLEYYKPREKNLQKSYDIIFSGNMAYPPNIDCALFLVKKIMPLVWKQNPNCKVVIVGTSPSNEVKKLASKNVIITGRVNDMRQYFYESKIFVGPLFINSGLQNKLLEAMAMKVPCITSTLANNALLAAKNKEIIIADTDVEFANEILKLLSNQALADSIATDAYNFVTQNHDWNKIGIHLNEILKATVNEQK